MFGLSNETQKKIGYGLVAGGVLLGGYALYKNMSKGGSKAKALSGVKKHHKRKKRSNGKKKH